MPHSHGNRAAPTREKQAPEEGGADKVGGWGWRSGGREEAEDLGHSPGFTFLARRGGGGRGRGRGGDGGAGGRGHSPRLTFLAAKLGPAAV